MNNQLETYTKAKLGDFVVPINEALEGEITNDIFPTGIDSIDEALAKKGMGGFRPGNLVVISGKSGHGKTLIAQNITRNLVEVGVPTLFFSYEVRIDDVYETFIEMGMKESPQIYTPKKHVTGDINWIKDKIREADKKYGSQVIVIDHLDFLTARDIKTSDVRRNEINNIVSELKTFAIDEKKVIILLAHVVKTKDRSLQNEDIADSRSIANLADIILFVGRELNDDGIPVENNGIIKMTKNRFTGKQVIYKFYVDENLWLRPQY